MISGMSERAWVAERLQKSNSENIHVAATRALVTFPDAEKVIHLYAIALETMVEELENKLK